MFSRINYNILQFQAAAIAAAAVSIRRAAATVYIVWNNWWARQSGERTDNPSSETSITLRENNKKSFL